MNNLGFNSSGYDIFVAHFDQNAVPIWLSYYGGSELDAQTHIAPIYNKEVFVAFSTNSADLVSKHTSQQYYENNNSPASEGFMLKLNSFGSDFSWSSYIQGVDHFSAARAYNYDGGTLQKVVFVGQHDYFNSSTLLAVNNPGNCYYDNSKGEGLILRFNDDCTLDWGTRFGGTSGEASEQINDVYIDGANSIYIAGTTINVTNASFPTFNNPNYPNDYVQGNNISNATDAFISKFNNVGGQLWSTLFGGSHGESGVGVTTDPLGNIYLTGNDINSSGTTTLPFDQTYPSGNYVETNCADGNGFIAQFDSEGKRLWGSLIEGTTKGVGVIANSDRLIVCGTTNKTNLPPQSNGNAYYDETLQNSYDLVVPDQDIFIVGFDHEGNKNYTTYFGGDYIDVSKRLYYAGSYYYLVGVTSGQDVDIPLWQPLPTSYFQDQSYPVFEQPNSDGFITKFEINFTQVGVEDQSSVDQEIKVFPNPTNNFFYILLTASANFNYPVEYSLHSIEGNLIQRGSLLKNDSKISFLNAPSGVYLLIIKGNEASYHQKIIKQ